MDLFEGDGAKIDEMNRRIAAAFGFERCFSVCGQTYPRKTDSRILNVLSSIAQSAYRMANDLRLLQHDRQVEEPFEKSQIGSSAMAYKRNPMRSERICSLSRYLMADAANAPMTASVQWLERTLDDSANRRISLPEGFLCADAVLRLCQNVTNGLHVNEKIVDRAIREYLPFLATENIMMEAVKRGGDRQELHEKIRQHSMAATARMKEGEPCDLLDRLAADPAFSMTRAELDAVMEPSLYIGRCKEQVERLLADTPPVRQHPNLMVLHASNRKTSNTIALWERMAPRLQGRVDAQVVSLRNGTVADCNGCEFRTCLHFGEEGRCFYGGVIVDEVYPAIGHADGVLWLCPNYNDALAANLTACINRLTALFRTTPFYDKDLYAIIVSGYSGGDIVAQQLISALCMNKAFRLPPRFCMLETANDAGAAVKLPGIDERLAAFADKMFST